eukprot:CAMPEP_0172607336 /NCGR_PEP_ID=MMETSP1068-20121228/27535_1 /TAXON_ID=35684 /ORGANISM="Pseudopedinella elastica, Strain CCMP716" /LENGTH=191 /DNA_ID=CAMNT_0013410309 /DNA_START=81 /DNA_END=653 /DNA_ORIENTATION=+
MALPPKKDYAESHGMTHGGFRDFLKTKGEAKTSEQLATERAVAQARAAAVARTRVAELRAGGKQLEGKAMDKELAAQAARAQALAHLSKNSCGPSQYELTGQPAKLAGGDNTLEIMAKRRAKEKKEQDKARQLKEQLLAQQAALRGIKHEPKAGGGDGEAAGPLPPGWREVADPSGSGVYYWNEVSNEVKG